MLFKLFLNYFSRGDGQPKETTAPLLLSYHRCRDALGCQDNKRNENVVFFMKTRGCRWKIISCEKWGECLQKCTWEMPFIRRRSERNQKSWNIHTGTPCFQWPKADNVFFWGHVCFQEAVNRCNCHHVSAPILFNPLEIYLAIYETYSYFSTVVPVFMDRGKLARPEVTLERIDSCSPNISGASWGDGTIRAKLP